MSPWREVTGHERPGDVVLLRVRNHPIHVGMVVEPGRMLHIMAGCDAVIESYNGLEWRHRTLGVFRYTP